MAIAIGFVQTDWYGFITQNMHNICIEICPKSILLSDHDYKKKIST